MLGSLIIVFREVLEAGLIIGIILAATKSVPHRGRWIFMGVGAGVIGACLVAAFAGYISQLFQGSGQELLNAGILLLAVVMLAWHNIWMSTHGREMAQEAKKLGTDVASGRKKLGALSIVVAAAILREGSEVVLFLYGLLNSDGETWRTVAVGGGLGLLLGAASTALIYWGLLAIPVRHFFTATTVLITFLAAGLASQAMAFLQQGGYLLQGAAPLWNTSDALPESGWLGRVLHTLLGYSDRPSVFQVIMYVATISAIVVLMRVVSRAHARAT